jgi:hypothetical protein
MVLLHLPFITDVMRSIACSCRSSYSAQRLWLSKSLCNEVLHVVSYFFGRGCLSLSSVIHSPSWSQVILAHTVHIHGRHEPKRISPMDTLVLHPDDRLFRCFCCFCDFDSVHRKDGYMCCQLCSLNSAPASLSDTSIYSYSYIIHCVGDCLQAIRRSLYLSYIIGTSVRLC